MSRTLASSLVAFLLMGTLLAGQCISCLQPTASAKTDCCKPSGRCEKPLPQDSGHKNCPKQDRALQNLRPAKTNLAVTVAIAVEAMEPLIALPPGVITSVAGVQNGLGHAPPDLCVLYSTFLL